MTMRRRLFTWIGKAALAAMVVAMAAPSYGAGFGIFEQGSKAMGMAGAFTAQADDGSAMFHNVGGLAFLDERRIEAGVTLITQTEAEFQGSNPFPGNDVFAEQEDALFFPPHVYYVQPISETLNFGFHFNTPFGLATEWQDVNSFPGRYISYNAELRALDLGANLGWKATPDFGLGFGLIARGSDVVLKQRVPLTSPFTFQVVDVADVNLESDIDWGVGFQAGVLHRYNNSFSWGFSYRSKIEIDYSGDAAFRQISSGNAQLDAAVVASLPVGQNVGVETTIEFPDMASFGVALALGPNTTLEVDANWTGWSSFETLVIDFDDAIEATTEVEDVVRSENWDDAYNYRVGLSYGFGNGELRLGYVYDETPQPEAAAGPLLPDNDRNGFTVGYGHQGDKLYTDIALMYLPFDELTVDESIDRFTGTYNITAWLLGVTVGWK